MLLSDCRSYLLLPRFAQNEFTESLCGAVDELIRRIAERCNALPCENSADALAACRDDELAQIADDLGVIPYYPDLPRATRENIILKAKTWTRYAGTVGAVIEMVNALFNTNHTTIDDALDDAFNYHIDIEDNFVESTEVNFKRFNECLEMLGHTTTTPDGFTFHYEGTFETNVTAVSGDVLVWLDTDKICEPVVKPDPEVVELLFGVNYDANSQQFTPQMAIWAGTLNTLLRVMSEDDKASLEAFGLSVNTDYAPYSVRWNDGYTYTPIAIYSDVAGENLITDDRSNMVCGHLWSSSDDLGILGVDSDIYWAMTVRVVIKKN